MNYYEEAPVALPGLPGTSGPPPPHLYHGGVSPLDKAVGLPPHGQYIMGHGAHYGIRERVWHLGP